MAMRGSGWIRSGEIPFGSSSYKSESLPDSVNNSQLQGLRKHGFVVRVMLQKPLVLDITLPPRLEKAMAEIVNYLKPPAAHIVWLNLSNNGLAADDVVILQHMENLEKLRLEKNLVSDDISNHLVNLPAPGGSQFK
jgi:hypothetical protein